jgi:hypothetical protein
MDVAAEPRRGVGRDLAPGALVDAQIDAFIVQRHDKRVQGEGEREAEELWKQSERRRAAAERAANREAWIEYYEGHANRLEASLVALVGDYRRKAERLRSGVA